MFSFLTLFLFTSSLAIASDYGCKSFDEYFVGNKENNRGAKRDEPKVGVGVPYISPSEIPMYIATGLFSTTTLSSACQIGLLEDEDEERVIYATANYQRLKEEIAIGDGERLNVLAELFGCSSRINRYFAGVLQAHYSSLFSSDNIGGEKLIANIKKIIKKNRTLKEECPF